MINSNLSSLFKSEAQIKSYQRRGPSGQMVDVQQYSQSRKEGTTDFSENSAKSSRTHAEKPDKQQITPQEQGANKTQVAKPEQFEKFKPHLERFKGEGKLMSMTHNKRTGKDYAIVYNSDKVSAVMVDNSGSIVASKGVSGWKAIPFELKDVFNDLHKKIPKGSGDKVGVISSESGTDLVYYHNKEKDEFAYYNIEDGFAGIRKPSGEFVKAEEVDRAKELKEKYINPGKTELESLESEWENSKEKRREAIKDQLRNSKEMANYHKYRKEDPEKAARILKTAIEDADNPIKYEAHIEESKKYFQSIDDETRKLVEGYTLDDHYTYNDHLIGKKEINEKGVERIEKISNFIKNAPKFEGISYRGIEFNSVERRGTYSDFISRMEEAKNSGEVLTEETFMSTSSSKREAMNFISLNRDGALLRIVGKNGTSVKEVSGLEDEEEILFDKQTGLRILDIKTKKENGVMLAEIYAEEA